MRILISIMLFLYSAIAFAQAQVKGIPPLVNPKDLSWTANLPWWGWVGLILVLIIIAIIIRGEMIINFILKLIGRSKSDKVKGGDIEVNTNGKYNLDDKLKSIDDTLMTHGKVLERIESAVGILQDDHNSLKGRRSEYEASMKATVEGVSNLIENELDDLKVDEKKTASNVERLTEKVVELIAETKAGRR